MSKQKPFVSRAANLQGAMAVVGKLPPAQWWLAELDHNGNPTLIDGAHSDRKGADQAKYLFDRLGFTKNRRLAVACVTIFEPKPSITAQEVETNE